MITQTAEYALRAVVCLAAHPDRALVTAELASRTRVPAGYLAKVMQQLVRGGLVRSKRGRGGGFVLARPPEVVSVLDVVNAVDPIPRVRACPLGLVAHADALCPLHRRLDEAAAIVEGSLRGSWVGELVGDFASASEPVKPPRALPVVRPGRRPRPSSGAEGDPGTRPRARGRIRPSR